MCNRWRARSNAFHGIRWCAVVNLIRLDTAECESVFMCYTYFTINIHHRFIDDDNEGAALQKMVQRVQKCRRTDIHDVDRTGRPSIARTDGNRAWLGVIHLENRGATIWDFSATFEVVVETVHKIVRESKSPIFTAKQFLHSWQDGKNAPVYPGLKVL